MQTTTSIKFISSLQNQHSFTLHNSLTTDLQSKVGIWKDGETSWLHEEHWRIAPLYKREEGVKLLAAYHPTYHLHVTIIERAFADMIGYHRQLFIRNEQSRAQEIKLLFHQWPMTEPKEQTVSFYAPISKALIHSDGQSYVTTFAKAAKEELFSYAVGDFDHIWNDKTGSLMSHSFVKQSSESVMAKSLFLPANGEGRVEQWMHAGESITESEQFMTKFGSANNEI